MVFLVAAQAMERGKDTLAVDAEGSPWWQENSKEAYSSGIEALSKGLSNWSKSSKGDRKGRKVGFPKFKAKDRVTPKFTYRTGCFGLVKGDPKALKLPRIGRVHCMENVAALVGDAKVLRMTISQHAALVRVAHRQARQQASGGTAEGRLRWH